MFTDLFFNLYRTVRNKLFEWNNVFSFNLFIIVNVVKIIKYQ